MVELLKIVYISNSVVPSRTANSVHVMKMCQALARQGHEVILITQDNKEMREDSEDIFSFYEVDPIFKIVKVRYPQNLKGISYIYGVKAAYIAKKYQPDIVYGRHLIGLFFSSKIFNLKTFLEIHQPLQNKKTLNFMFKSIIKNKKFNKIIVITKSLQDYFTHNYKLNKEQVFIAHDGADIPKANTKKAELEGTNKLNIGYVGQLYKGKGMELIEQMARQYPDGNFHIIGGLKEDIEFWKDKTKDISNIHFYGFVPHSKTGEYIIACDVMLAPYMNVVHGFGNNQEKINLVNWMSPLKLFEYMSYSKPVITSDLPVIKEVLTNNENAFLCNPSDIDSWIKTLEMLNNNKLLTESIGINAKDEFIKNYTWEKRSIRIIDAISNVNF